MVKLSLEGKNIDAENGRKMVKSRPEDTWRSRERKEHVGAQNRRKMVKSRTEGRDRKENGQVDTGWETLKLNTERKW